MTEPQPDTETLVEKARRNHEEGAYVIAARVAEVLALAARLAETEAQRDKYAREAGGHLHDLLNARSQVATLEAALRKYGRHKDDCHYARELRSLRAADSWAAPINACSCGWAALDSLPSQPAQPEITQEQADAYLAALRRTDSIGSSQPAASLTAEDAAYVARRATWEQQENERE